MAIEIIPKQVKEVPLWQSVLPFFAVVLLVAVVLAGLAIGHYQKKSGQILQGQEKTLSEERAAYLPLEEQVLEVKEKIDDFVVLVENHKMSSNFFVYLEGVIHPQAWFPSFNFDLEKSQVKVSGVTENFSTLGQQSLILQREEKIKGVNLFGISISKEGRVDFHLDLLPSSQIISL